MMPTKKKSESAPIAEHANGNAMNAVADYIDPFAIRHPIVRGEPTWDITHLFPAQGQWSESDYLSLDTNRMIELSNGTLEVLPMPTPSHQFILKFLIYLLDAFVKANAEGDVLFAPLPIRLWPGQLREPDLLFLRPNRIVDRRKPPEGADLVMEIVSEGAENRQRDIEIKRREYAQARIEEYWIVDPQLQTITVLVLDGSSYRVHGEFRVGELATSVTLPGFSADVAAKTKRLTTILTDGPLQ
jgi:Uma2 family endonuclease